MSTFNKFFVYLKKTAKAFLQTPSIGMIGQCVRYFPAWLKSHDRNRSSVVDKLPWISFAAIDFLRKNINLGGKVFEYGSGGSTLFWASRAEKIVSVEHDKRWYEIMKPKLSGLNHVTYILAEPQEDLEFRYKDPADPANFVSADEKSKGKNFEWYVKQIDQYPDNYFDVISIDGRARPSCIARSVKKLKINGYLILDNSEREYYLSSFDFNQAEWVIRKFYGPVPYIYHFSETTFFEKKGESLSIVQLKKN
jgi:hypothetical protein